MLCWFIQPTGMACVSVDLDIWFLLSALQSFQHTCPIWVLLLYYLLLLCGGMCVPQSACRGRRTTLRSWLSPSPFWRQDLSSGLCHCVLEANILQASRRSSSIHLPSRWRSSGISDGSHHIWLFVRSGDWTLVISRFVPQMLSPLSHLTGPTHVW